MSHIQLSGIDCREALKNAAEDRISGVMSHLFRGTWRMTDVTVTSLAGGTLHVEPSGERNNGALDIRIDQPVGMSLVMGSNKYIFESEVAGFEPSVNKGRPGTIILTVPDRIEKMQRRSDIRVKSPEPLKVKVLFWHRGYADDSTTGPTENYWQGNLIDISAMGLRISIDLEQENNFQVGQFIDIQFTPMPYDKPLHLEGHVKHMSKSECDGKLCLGIQAIGLEATRQGRAKLQRMNDIVAAYRAAGGTCYDDSAKKEFVAGSSGSISA
jgi:hypothetical protein